ncbi:MAG: L,D-transpeptidase family protein [Candidatus Omnitrophica bacterium]|nr:L,D-transpeptidase family protein [Candidatus Omnitrophota bacterium]
MFNRRNVIIISISVVILFALVLFIRGRGTSQSRVVEATVAEATPQNSAPNELFQQAMTYKNDGDLVKSQEILRTINNDYSDYQDMELVQSELEKTNMALIFSNVPTPDSVTHEVVKGDTLGELAKRYGTTIDLIKKSNNLNTNVIRLGQKLRIWTGKFNIFVDKSQNKLILKEGETVVKVYTVSTGKDSSTPEGTFKITSKLEDPVWFNKGVVVPPESPANVLGSRWLGFDNPGYGIHGTIEPDKMGQQVTAGCVRMLKDDVEELYSLIPLGTEVNIVN